MEPAHGRLVAVDRVPGPYPDPGLDSLQRPAGRTHQAVHGRGRTSLPALARTLASLARRRDTGGATADVLHDSAAAALVSPGDLVVLKPNLICQGNWDHPDRWEEVVTHPAVIRAVLDEVLKALDGKGRVVICDGPQTDADFDLLLARTGLGDLVARYRAEGHPIELLDLRQERWITEGGVTREKLPLPGDPNGNVRIDLGERSAFSTYSGSGHFYGADYNMEETRRFHSERPPRVRRLRHAHDGRPPHQHPQDEDS